MVQEINSYSIVTFSIILPQFFGEQCGSPHFYRSLNINSRFYIQKALADNLCGKYFKNTNLANDYMLNIFWFNIGSFNCFLNSNRAKLTSCTSLKLPLKISCKMKFQLILIMSLPKYHTNRCSTCWDYEYFSHDLFVSTK